MTKRFGNIHKSWLLIGGGIGLAAGAAVRLSVGSPIPCLRLLGADALLPPLWLMALLWLGVYALAGCAAGHLLSCPAGGARREALLWRGGTFLVLSVTFSFAWYSLLFSSFCLLPSWLCLLVSVAFAVLCAMTWWRLNRLCALVAVGVGVWFLCLWLLQLAVILHN